MQHAPLPPYSADATQALSVRPRKPRRVQLRLHARPSRALVRGATCHAARCIGRHAAGECRVPVSSARESRSGRARPHPNKTCGLHPTGAVSAQGTRTQLRLARRSRLCHIRIRRAAQPPMVPPQYLTVPRITPDGARCCTTCHVALRFHATCHVASYVRCHVASYATWPCRVAYANGRAAPPRSQSPATMAQCPLRTVSTHLVQQRRSASNG